MSDRLLALASIALTPASDCSRLLHSTMSGHSLDSHTAELARDGHGECQSLLVRDDTIGDWLTVVRLQGPLPAKASTSG